MKISVLTPTYNRANLLEQLYKSLIANADYGIDIEWLIMNDGSKDKTEEIVNNFIHNNQSKIEIKYFKQENSGKMTAINNLTKEATGEYMIDCDSDDYFTNDAFKIMKEKIEKSKNEENIYGLCFLKYNEKGENIGKVFTKKRTTLFDMHYKENEQGEKAILFLSKIRKKYSHELENGEKFVTEARMYYKMDDDNDLLCFNAPIMICEYKEDGYTKNLENQFKENPFGYYKYFQEILGRNMRGSILNKRLYAIKHYILFTTLTKSKKNIRPIKDMLNKVLVILLYIPGTIMTKMKFK